MSHNHQKNDIMEKKYRKYKEKYLVLKKSFESSLQYGGSFAGLQPKLTKSQPTPIQEKKTQPTSVSAPKTKSSTQTPVVTQAPVVTQVPVVTQQPQAPVVTQQPQAPVVTQQPQSQQAPVVTQPQTQQPQPEGPLSTMKSKLEKLSVKSTEYLSRIHPDIKALVTQSGIPGTASPTRSQSGSVVSQARSVVSQASPTRSQSGSVVSQARSVVSQASPTRSQSGSVVSQASPTRSQSGSVVSQASQAAHAISKLTSSESSTTPKTADEHHVKSKKHEEKVEQHKAMATSHSQLAELHQKQANPNKVAEHKKEQENHTKKAQLHQERADHHKKEASKKETPPSSPYLPNKPISPATTLTSDALSKTASSVVSPSPTDTESVTEKETVSPYSISFMSEESVKCDVNDTVWKKKDDALVKHVKNSKCALINNPNETQVKEFCSYKPKNADERQKKDQIKNWLTNDKKIFKSILEKCA
ncbi:hypothetical protein CPAV1605_851 [seawater metagenome]|uniref:Uncharacterized protein n=1 Tax=seawater metagenome TaxID=1561972 RepID=A0A5E8CJ20_9ZZZZ